MNLGFCVGEGEVFLQCKDESQIVKRQTNLETSKTEIKKLNLLANAIKQQGLVLHCIVDKMIPNTYKKLAELYEIDG